MGPYFQSAPAAAEYLKAEGFKRVVDELGPRWVKPSKVDDFYGGYSSPAIVHIKRNRVAPEYGKPDFFSLEFI